MSTVIWGAEVLKGNNGHDLRQEWAGGHAVRGECSLTLKKVLLTLFLELFYTAASQTSLPSKKLVRNLFRNSNLILNINGYMDLYNILHIYIYII